MLDVPKQFIQTQPVASVDRGSEWIGGECDGFLCGAEGSSYIGVNEDGDDVFATTFWRSLWGDLFAIVRGRAKGRGYRFPSAKRTGAGDGVDGRRCTNQAPNVAADERMP